MIQRIQTIWLLLASACAFISIRLPFYVGTNKSGVASYELTGMENLYLTILSAAIGFLAIVIIFLFKNRKLQIRLSVLGMMLELFLIFLYYMQVRTFTAGTYALTALLHSAVVLFFFLTIRAIGKDIRLIKNSNRLR